MEELAAIGRRAVAGRRRRARCRLQRPVRSTTARRSPAIAPSTLGSDDVPRRRRRAGSSPPTTPMAPNSPTPTTPTTKRWRRATTPDDAGVDGEEHPDADEQRRLVVRAERVDGELLDERRRGVDEAVADVEHGRTPRPVEPGEELGDGEGDAGGRPARRRRRTGRRRRASGAFGGREKEVHVRVRHRAGARMDPGGDDPRVYGKFSKYRLGVGPRWPWYFEPVAPLPYGRSAGVVISMKLIWPIFIPG